MPRPFPLMVLPLSPLLVACLAVSGCAPAAAPPQRAAPAAAAGDHGSHDHGAEGGHKHPETLAAALAELEGTWAAVKSSLAAGEHDKADEKVHAAGHLLEDFEKLLAKEIPAGDAAAAGKKALEEILTCFDTLDEAVHEGAEAIKKLDVEALGGRIGEAVKTLKGLGTKDR
jgi:hypothetical protein